MATIGSSDRFEELWLAVTEKMYGVHCPRCKHAFSAAFPDVRVKLDLLKYAAEAAQWFDKYLRNVPN